MFERLDEIIDKNLKMIFESRSQSSFRLYSLEDESYNENDTKRLAIIMQDENLVFATGRKCDISPFGLEVSRNGGWLKYIENKAKAELKHQSNTDAFAQLEIKLAKSNIAANESNIEANKLSAKIAEQNSLNESKNRIATWVNISVGVFNILLLAIQIWLIIRKP